MSVQLVICTKSAWLPPIRREHEVAGSAATDGHEVVFIERALHARALRSPGSRRAWLRAWRAAPVATRPRICVLAQATVVPGQRSGLAQRTDALRLAHTLRGVADIERSVVVATHPWHWPAVAAAPAWRRVMDCDDDWRRLIPSRAQAIGALYDRIGREADAVILASEDLRTQFGSADIHVVGNGASNELLRTPPQPLPREPRMVYAGTLSERFDAPFVFEVLARLPGWTVDLYGHCQYAGRDDRPSDELLAALDACDGRLRWHGPVLRAALAGALDSGRVLIVPHRGSHTVGQDSMKLYDYASRGRPIVCTRGSLGSPQRTRQAGVLEAATPEEFAATVVRAAGEQPGAAARRRAWVAEQGWDRRWPLWSAAAFGEPAAGHDQ